MEDLAYKAKLDITEAEKNVEQLLKRYKELGKEANNAYSVKPMTEFQAAQLKIKQDALEFAKQKAEQARADREASLATQAALKEEARLRREAAAAAKEQEKAAAAAAKSAKRPVDFGTYGGEANPNPTTVGDSGKVNTAFTSYLKQVKADFDAGKISASAYVAELERYSTVVVDNAKSTGTATKATKELTLSKQELEKIALQEKLNTQQQNANLKNSVREMNAAKGSIEQRRAALVRLNSVYDNLNASERNSASGQRLKGIVSNLTSQVKTLEAETGRAQRNVGNYLGKAWGGLKSVANLLPGVGLAGLLAFAVDPILEYVSKLNIFKTKLTESKIAQEDMAKALSGGDYAKAVTNVNELRINIDLAKKGFIDKEAVLKQYNESIGKTTGQVKTLDQAEQELNKNADAFIKVTLLKAAAQVALETAAKSAYEAEISRRKKLEEFGNQFTDAAGSLGTTNAVTGEVDVKRAKERGDKLVAERKRRQLAEVKISQDAANQQINIAKKFQEDAAKLSKKNNFTNFLGNDKDKTDKTVKDGQSALEAQRSLQASIDEMVAKSKRKKLSDDEEEIANIKANYQKKIDEAVRYNDKVKTFNADPKNKFNKTLVSVGGLITAMDNDVRAAAYKQETAKQAEEFEKQKQLFADYEAYKTTFGEAEAKKRFGNEVKTNAQLIAELEKQVSSLAGKSATSGLNEGETARLAQKAKELGALKTQQEAAYKNAYEAALTYEQSVLRINKEYADKAVLIRQKAAKEGINPDAQIAVLNQKWQAELDGEKQNAYQKTAVYREQAKQVLEITRKQVKDQIEALKLLLDNNTIPAEIKEKIQKEINNLEVALKIGIDQNNLEAINEQIDLLQRKLSAKDTNGNSLITDEEFANAEGKLQELIKLRNELDRNNDGKVNWLDGLSKNFEYLGKSASEVLTGVSNDLGQVSGSFGDLSSALGGVNTEAGYTLDTIGQLVGVASDAAGAAASFASGDIIGGVTKTIKAISGIFSIGKKVKEMNAAARKEVEDFYTNAIAGEKAYQDSLRERELQTIRNNKAVLQGIRDEIALRKSQTADYAKETADIMAKLQGQSYISDVKYTHGTWFRKAKTENIMSSLNGKSYAELSQLLAQGKLQGDAKALVERLQELEQKGYDAAQAMADLAKETNALFTGTTADALTDSFANLFKEGKTDVKDFTDFFEQSMEDAALNIFKNNILAKMIEKFYDDFAKAASSGDELTATEIEALRIAFNKMTVDAQSQFEKLTGSTGLFPKVKVPIELEANVKEVGDQLFDLLTKSAKETGKTIEEILKQSILDGLRAEIITNALKPLADKIKALYANGNIPTKEDIAKATEEMNAFIANARLQLKKIEEATGLTFAEQVEEDLGGAIKTIDSELQSISDSIRDVFANTDGAYENFLTKFDDMVKNKILNTFQTSFLQTKLVGFLEQFNALDKVEDGKKAEQLALLKAQYAKIIADGKLEYERLQDVFGVDYKPVASQSQGAISSAIGRTITEETANVIAGPIVGTYEEAKRISGWMGKCYAIATQNLEVAIKIEANTRRGADNTDGIGAKLDEIARNTRKSPSSTLNDNYLRI